MLLKIFAFVLFLSASSSFALTTTTVVVTNNKARGYFSLEYCGLHCKRLFALPMDLNMAKVFSSLKQHQTYNCTATFLEADFLGGYDAEHAREGAPHALVYDLSCEM